MRLRVLLAAIAFSFGCIVCAQADVIVYDAAENFLTGDNPNGAWTYGCYDPAVGLSATSFTPFEYKTDWAYRDGGASNLISWQRSHDLTDPSFVVNQSASVVDVFAYLWQPGKLAVDSWHLNPQVVPVLRWQAPQAGTVDISATFTDMGASTCTAQVFDNNIRPLFSAPTAGGASYSNPSSIYVDAGDCIYFRTVGGSVTQLDATVSLTPGSVPIPPVPAGLVEFSTDPNLATEWTSSTYYDYNYDGCPNTTATWNEADQNLALVSAGEEGLRTLSQTGTTWSAASDRITIEFSDFISSVLDPGTGGWTSCGLVISAERTPFIFNGMPQYSLSFEVNAADGIFCGFSKGADVSGLGIVKQVFATMPDSVTLDIVYDSDTSEYVFLLNDEELARDSTYGAEELPYYSLYWGTGAADAMSISVDNFGVVTNDPKPGDANRNGVVDAVDASILASNWLMQSGATWRDGDFNDDGAVNDIDATLLAANWQGNANSSVPEPSAAISIIIGLIFLFACGYRNNK